MEQKEEKQEKQLAGISISLNLIVLVGVLLGIVLLIMGAGIGNFGNKPLYLTGLALTTLSLFTAGLLQKEENNVVRLGFLLAGAITLGYLLRFNF